MPGTITGDALKVLRWPYKLPQMAIELGECTFVLINQIGVKGFRDEDEWLADVFAEQMARGLHPRQAQDGSGFGNQPHGRLC